MRIAGHEMLGTHMQELGGVFDGGLWYFLRGGGQDYRDEAKLSSEKKAVFVDTAY